LLGKTTGPSEVTFKNLEHRLQGMAGDGRDLLWRASGFRERGHRGASKVMEVQFHRFIPVVWDGEAKHNPTKWLVRDLIPMASIGLIVGEASSGKSFAAIDLARALARGGTFLTKATRKGGTLYVAAEAAGTIPGRLKAARLGPLAPFLDEHGRFKDNGREPDRLPICVISHPPGLLNDNEVNRLIATATDVSTKMQERFEVPLRLVIIDTLLAAFPINDWNSPAEVSRVMDVLARIARKTGAVVLGVHHHGKDVSRGPAGSFALKAASDVVLSVFAETDNEGNVTGRRITVSKLRDGQTGWGCDFTLVPHKIGTDDEGIDIMSAYLQPTKGTAGFGRPRPTKPKNHSQASSAFEEAVVEALDKFGVNQPLNGIGPGTRVVPLAKVRDVFHEHYKPEGHSDHPRMPSAVLSIGA
jgi:AAA domain